MFAYDIAVASSRRDRRSWRANTDDCRRSERRSGQPRARRRQTWTPNSSRPRSAGNTDSRSPVSTAKTTHIDTHTASCPIFRLDALALSVIATATWLGGWVAGWLAVTLRYCIKTAKPIGKLFRPSESPIILVFWDPCADTKFQGEPLQRGR